MKIVIVCPYDLGLPGGVQQVATELAGRLVSDGEEVVLAAPGSAGLPPGVSFVSTGTSTTVRANGSRAPVTLQPAAWRRTLEACEGADVVHVHEPFVPLVGWAALSARDYPKVVTFHADPPRWARRAYATLAPVGSRALGTAVLTAPSEVAASAIPSRWGTATVIPNGLDVASFAVDVPRNPLRVAFLGRDEPRKGLSVLLQAWPMIEAEHPAAELIVMGAHRATESDRIRFVGVADISTKLQTLASSQVFVAPNLGGESFGIVVAEAMAAGCAVVASALPAFERVLGTDGVTVPPGEPKLLAAEVSKLLADPFAAANLGQKAGQSARRFDWGVVTSMYRAAYSTAKSL